MKTYHELIKNLRKDFSGLKRIRVALLGDSATQMLVKSFVGIGFEKGYHFDTFESDYNQMDLMVYDSNSDLYKFNPEYVILFNSTEKLCRKFYATENQNRSQFAVERIEQINAACSALSGHLNCKIILFNYPEINDELFGNYGTKVSSSFIYQIRKLNFELMNLAQNHNNVFINDVASLYSKYGQNFCKDSKMHVHADIVYSLDFLPFVAKNLSDIILSLSGKIKKCLILDLDNTLWGGIIGDDGVENIKIGELGTGKAFTQLQSWIKQLKQRGILLAVCSKNEEDNARAPFLRHPDMVLRLDDFVVFKANWENKAQNIQEIQSVLNIGYDSMVFLDDNPFERNMVRTHLPDVEVPELPEDPAEYLAFLQGLNLFETATYTDEDDKRTQQYREENQRLEIKRQFINEDDFLQALQMKAEVEQFTSFTIPRIAQLSQRSNQFNLRTIRYTESELEKISGSKGYLTLSFTLSDKYGDHGLIGAIILEKQEKQLFINTWIMSCRVLKRGMENFILNQMVQCAMSQGYETILAEYIPTSKNGMVKDHYPNLGFLPVAGQPGTFRLSTTDYITKKTFISA